MSDLLKSELKYEYVTTEDRFYHVIQCALASDYIVIDTETTGLDPHTLDLLLFQINCGGNIFVIDFTKLPRTLLKRLVRVFKSPIVKIMHNSTFDLKVIYKYTDVWATNVFDTMIAERILFAGLNKPADLGSVLNRRLGISVDKSIRLQFIGMTSTVNEEQIQYAAADVAHLALVKEQQEKEIKEKGLEFIAYEIEMRLLPVTAMMEYTGVPFDKTHLEKLAPEVEHLCNVAYKLVQDAFISAGAVDTIVFEKDGYHAVNPNSNAGEKSIKTYLARVGVDIDSLGAKHVAKWDLDHRRTKYDLVLADLIGDEDDDTVDAITLFGSLENPYLKAITFYKGVSKLYSTYILGLQEHVNPKTKRVHFHFNQMGTKTGRMSSTQPNGQNMPTQQKMESLRIKGSVREAICTPHALVIADFSAIELVIIADQSGDPTLMREVDPERGDVHTLVAREILRVADITAQNRKKEPYSIWRQGAKRLSYSKAYGVHGASLAQQLTVDLALLGIKYSAADGLRMIEEWDRLFPLAGIWLKSNYNHAIEKGYVSDPLGRKRFWDRQPRTKPQLGAMGREGSNFPVQSTSANMTKLALIRLYDTLDLRYARPILQVHDEIVIESTKAYAPTAAMLLKQGMEYGAQQTLTRLAHYVIVTPSISTKYDK